MTTQVDPFSDYRTKGNRKAGIPVDTIPQTQNIKSPDENPENDPFASYRKKKVEGFPFLYEGGRHIARLGSRVAEVIGGIPGDISSLIQSGVFSGLEKISGHKPSEEAYEKIKKQRLPTSRELKEFSQEATKGFTSPQGKTEELIDEFAETAASLLGPIKFRKALGISAGATAVKEGTKALGFGEKPQEAAKLGTIILLSVLNPGGALKYASNQYQRANQLAKGASVDAINFKKNLRDLSMDLQKGVSTPSKNAVLKPTEELISKINPEGKIGVQELTAAKRDLNTLMKDPLLLKREKKLLKHLGHEVDKAIQPFEKLNPEFSKAYRPANQIYGAVMEGGKISNYITKHLGTKSVLGAIIGETILGHPELIVPTVGTAIGTMGAARSVDFATRIFKSKELRKYYFNALEAAAKKDLPSLRLYERKLEKGLKED